MIEDTVEIQLTSSSSSSVLSWWQRCLFPCVLTNFAGVTGPPFTWLQNIICCDIIKKRSLPTRNANTQSSVIDSIVHHCPEKKAVVRRNRQRKTYMSCAVASAASFEFACYHAQDVSIKMSDSACGLSPLIYNKVNKLKFGFFMGRILTQYQFAICLFLFQNVKTQGCWKNCSSWIQSIAYILNDYMSALLWWLRNHSVQLTVNAWRMIGVVWQGSVRLELKTNWA